MKEIKAETRVTALERNKEMLSYEVLKKTVGFLKENAVDGVEVTVTTENPTMTMTEDGKYYTGKTLLCTINTWKQELEEVEDD